MRVRFVERLADGFFPDAVGLLPSCRFLWASGSEGVVDERGYAGSHADVVIAIVPKSALAIGLGPAGVRSF